MIEQLWSDLIEFTSQFVIPDWGTLISLLPVFLAVPVFLYITWTIYRWRRPGPTRSGKRRLTPVPPPGIHMPGRSFAPFVAAAGMFLLVFGLVEGGIWLAVGGIALVLTLLYWGREALREYDHLPSPRPHGRDRRHARSRSVLPPGRADAGTPPPGVHIPAALVPPAPDRDRR